MSLLKSLLVVCLVGCGHLATPADAKSLDTLEPTRHLLAKKATQPKKATPAKKNSPPSKSKAPAKTAATPPAPSKAKGKQARLTAKHEHTRRADQSGDQRPLSSLRQLSVMCRDGPPSLPPLPM